MTSEEELEYLRAENARLLEERARLRRRLAEARDATPVQKPGFLRVNEMAKQACLSLQKVGSKWEVSFGSRKRIFRFLREIWEFLLQDSWLLSDLFPPVIATEGKTEGKSVRSAKPIFKPRFDSLAPEAVAPEAAVPFWSGFY